MRGKERPTKPAVSFLDRVVLERMVAEARCVRCAIGVEGCYPGVVSINAFTAMRDLQVGVRGTVEELEVERLLASYRPSPLPDEAKGELTGLMERNARRCGMDALPHGRLAP